MKKFRQFMIRSERLGSLSTENNAAGPMKRLILLEQLPYAHGTPLVCVLLLLAAADDRQT